MPPEGGLGSAGSAGCKGTDKARLSFPGCSAEVWNDCDAPSPADRAAAEMPTTNKRKPTINRAAPHVHSAFRSKPICSARATDMPLLCSI
eukprot:CAMPEP_0115421568 /NCGR_PEP_ID=MMETSP0271-20121206/26319_1 /TAXON_ID=71861 /ORGANISM="Scrippsiella trochoidea, Strain CCMP3099" /LENGTH=89 /DNA_ID=CAMNT_0002846215 /DNA_START=10 /DNA_END=276 /DNA_ORIENTATION=-